MNVPFRRGSGSRRIAATPIPFLLVLVLGGAVAGCSGDHDGPAAGVAAAPVSATAHATMAPDAGAEAGEMSAGSTGVAPNAEEVTASWAARPDFVSGAGERTQAAYAFALARPDVLRWMPCYCGCGEMGHTGNLDCFIKPTEGAPVVFEEHGSYCDICVNIALTAQDMMTRGATLAQMRAAIDAEFGGSIPGTPTELPPA